MKQKTKDVLFDVIVMSILVIAFLTFIIYPVVNPSGL